eukprot:4814946-Prymnesium_polylepis.1
MSRGPCQPIGPIDRVDNKAIYQSAIQAMSQSADQPIRRSGDQAIRQSGNQASSAIGGCLHLQQVLLLLA